MNSSQVIAALESAHEVAAEAMAQGHHPFGAVLVAPDGATILDRQGNIDTVNHAEATLARRAAANYPADYLWGCTLVSTAEPCAMCAGTQYWANIGRLVYGLSEKRLAQLTGIHPENPTLDLPCRVVFAASHKSIEVIGPVTEVEEKIAAVHRQFWSKR